MHRVKNKRVLIFCSIAAAVLLFVGYTRVLIPMSTEESGKERTYYNADGSVDWDTTHIMNYHLAQRHKNLYEAVQKRA